MNSRYDRIASRNFVTSEDIRAAQARGDGHLAVRENSTVTDEARELAMKLGIRLDIPGASAPSSRAAQPAQAPQAAPAAPAMGTLPEDTGRRVADAIAAVLAELNLGARAAALAPILTRRVFAGLAKAAERK